jgi:hypothetical protein
MVDDVAACDRFTRDIAGCVHDIPQLKHLLPTLPTLAAGGASLQAAQLQQLVYQQQWFRSCSTVLRDALSLLKLSSSWSHLAGATAFQKYGNVLHLVGQAWCSVAVQLAGTTSEALVAQQTIQSSEQVVYKVSMNGCSISGQLSSFQDQLLLQVRSGARCLRPVLS